VSASSTYSFDLEQWESYEGQFSLPAGSKIEVGFPEDQFKDYFSTLPDGEPDGHVLTDCNADYGFSSEEDLTCKAFKGTSTITFVLS